MKIITMLLSLRSSVRRRYYCYFKKKHVEEMLSKRQGSCEGCEGVCCYITRICPFIEDGKCKLYKKGIPFFCKVFPIDEKDIELAGVADVCKYYWKK